MCDIVNDGVLNCMSVIIGICGVNFCTFWADMRQVSYLPDGTFDIANDHTQKIFKLNDRVLFGAAGKFRGAEDISAPTLAIPNLERASVKIVKTAVVDYLKKQNKLYGNLTVRNYLVGGKQNNGTFIIYNVHWNSDTQKVEVSEYAPHPPASTFALSMALPNGDPHYMSMYESAASDCIRLSTTDRQLDTNISDLIRKISETDRSVSPESMSLQIL